MMHFRQTVAADNKSLIDGEYDQISMSDYDAGDWIDDPGMVEAEGFNLLDVVPPDGSFAAIDKVVSTSVINDVNEG